MEYIKISLKTYNEMLLKNHEYDIMQPKIQELYNASTKMLTFIHENNLDAEYDKYVNSGKETK